MSLNGNSPHLKTEVNDVVTPVTDRRAFRRRAKTEDEITAAAARSQQAHQDRLNALELATRELEYTELKQETDTRIRSKSKRAKREEHDETVKRLKEKAPGWVRTALVTGPIVSPMAVAWTSQTAFANKTLGWPGPAGIVFAAAWEASTAFCGWMYHEARKDGDRGTPYKVATWAFALGAGVMNYWHNMPGNNIAGTPTAKAVSYGVMSITGIALWELYTRLIHRKHLRSKGVINEARPNFGLLRWARFPKTTFRAWSATVKSQKTMTIDEAWKTGQDETTGLDRRPDVKVTVVRETKTPVMTLPKARVRLIWTDSDAVRKTITSGQDQPVLTEQSRVVPQLEQHKTTQTETKTTARSNVAPRPKTADPKPVKTAPVKTDDEIKTGVVVKNKPTNQDRDHAISLYIESVKNGEALTKAALAEKTGFSLSWSYTQILTARQILETETE